MLHSTSIPEPFDAPAAAGAPINPAAELLRVDRCPNCGYCLAGLDDEGTCPECGGDYTQSEIVLHGAARGVHAGLHNSRLLGGAGMVIVEVLCGAYLIAHSLGGNQPYRWLVLIWVIAGATMPLVQRSLAGTPGLVRVRMCAAGCFQEDAPDSSPVFHLLYFLWGTAGLCFWVACLLSPEPTLFAAPLGVAVALWGIRTRERMATRLRIARSLGTGGTAPKGQSTRLATVFVPWTDIQNIEVNPISGKAFYRVRMSTEATRWTWLGDVADIEIPLTQQQAQELAQRVQAWRLAALEAAFFAQLCYMHRDHK